MNDGEWAPERWLPMIRAVAGRIGSRSNVSGALVEDGDLISEGVLALAAAKRGWKPDRGAQSTYVWQRVRGAMLDYLRKARIGGRNQSLGERVPIPNGHDDAPGPEELLERAQLHEALKRMTESLSVRQRLAIRLRFYLGLRHREIAEVMGISEGRVSQIVKLALERLRVRWKREMRAQTLQ